MSADLISLLLFSDTHIGFDHPPNNKATKNRRRGFDFFDNFKLIIEKALELQVDYVIHCGDVFEKQNIPAFLVDQTYQEFLRLANAGIKVFIVPGNHERSVLPSSLFLNHSNIHVFDKAMTFSFPGISISGFPYFRGDIRTLFSSYKKNLNSNLKVTDFNILCVHHAIDGVKAGYSNFEFRNRKDTLDIKDLPGKFDLILSGHIHKHQIMEATESGRTTPIIYSGSTERTMFDEMYEVKGYHTFEIKSKKFKHQFHPIVTRPMYSLDLRKESVLPDQLPTFLKTKMAPFEKDAIVQISSDHPEILYKLSELKTQDFFSSSMNITISGFSSLQRSKSAN